jgi:hypothetical protein
MTSLNAGVLQIDYVEVDMSDGISGAGVHAWNPASNTGITAPEAVSVVGKDPTAAEYLVSWDHDAGDRFIVKEVVDTGDGTGGVQDLAQGTDAGIIKVRIEGRR